jgi:alpha-tubulin suppressor-like RCC1 family protein
MRRWGLVAALVAASIMVTTGPVNADANEAPVGNIPAAVITAGNTHTCAILDGGDVTCWGRGTNGQLGYGNPNTVGDVLGEIGAAVDLGDGRTATSLAAGTAHTCAILDTGGVKCWGNGGFGRLGNGGVGNIGDGPGEMGNALAPIDLGTGRTARAITAGSEHTCALLDNNTVKCWGNGGAGRLGQGNEDNLGASDGQMGDALQPISLGTGRTARAVTAGSQHTCALLDNGAVKCWGDGLLGQLGQGDPNARGDEPGEMGNALLPIDLGTGRTARAITAGSAHTCALLDNRTVKCWGDGSFGRLGNGDRVGDDGVIGDEPGEMGNALLPIDLGTGRTATAITAGSAHTCALLDDRSVKCWGNAALGRLGNGDRVGDDGVIGDGPGEMGNALLPVDLGTGRTATAVTTGALHTCALLDTGTLKCWGDGFDWQLGYVDNANIGDQSDEMGDDLPAIDLPRLVGRAAATVGLSADRSRVVAGTTITYTVSVRNTGTIPLTQVTVQAPDTPTCARVLPTLAPQTTSRYTCTYATTAADVDTMTNRVLVTATQGIAEFSALVETRVDDRAVRADGLVRAGKKPFLGNGTYNTTGARQTATATTKQRKAVRYTWRVQNDGNVPGQLKLRGTKGTTTFTVTYKRGSKNVTKAVRRGTYTTAALAPGATTDITVTVKPTKKAKKADTLTLILTARSTTPATTTDTVRAVTTRR